MAAEAGCRIEALQAELDDAKRKHADMLGEAKAETKDEREKGRLVAQEMSTFVAGLREELEVCAGRWLLSSHL
jgi:hypothetical protein